MKGLLRWLVPALAWPLLTAAATAQEWPSFRGPHASGTADGQDPPTTWNAETGTNILWRTPILGLGHSSPAVWGNRVFVTTAESPGREPYLRVGLYGESPDNPEEYLHHYRLYCLDRKTGKILWERTARSGEPQVKRHIKSSHANPTPATDGTRVVASFGSEGLHAYDMDGELLWRVDLGYLDAGAWDVPEIQWGFGSSPIIHGDRVIVLCDVNNQSFIAAFDAATGEELWRTLRDEVPTWGTPTVDEAHGRRQVLVNGFRHIGGYDLETGAELWRMRGGGDVPVPTPVVAHGLVFITNAHGPLSPIYAIRADARGDVSLDEGETSNEFVAWSRPMRGSYLPTPIVYGDQLYVANDRGILTAYTPRTGEQLYRVRLAGSRGAYAASAVAADGRVYFTNEDCETHVVRAGPRYEHLATNRLDGVCLATPAISKGMLLVRTSTHLWAVGETDERLVIPEATIAQTPLEKRPSPAPAASDAPAELDGPPADALSDPVAILRRADAASRAVESARYDIVVEETGAAKGRIGSLQATTVAAGFVQGLPERFLVEGTARVAGSTEEARFSGGSDGDIYFLVDHGAKTVYQDLEPRVMGSFVRAVFGAIVTEFHDPAPFQAEIDGTQHELRGSEEIGGEECYEIHLSYGAEGLPEVTWYISKSDFLPRGRHDVFDMPNGEKGGLRRTIRNLVVDPELDPGFFEARLPEGYTKTDEIAP